MRALEGSCSVFGRSSHRGQTEMSRRDSEYMGRRMLRLGSGRQETQRKGRGGDLLV